MIKLFNKRIIIGGLPRSGSTLLRFFLDTNKEIISGPETAFFLIPLYQTQKKSDKLFLRIRDKLGIEQSIYLDAIGEKNSILAFDHLMSHYREITGNDKKRCWAEKTPRNVFHYHRLYNETDYDLKFISTIRNGLDVVTSEYPKTDPRYKKRRYWVSVQEYVDCMKAIFSFENRNHYLFSYEKFVKNPHTEGENLFEFIGLTFDPRAVDDFNKTSVMTRDLSKVTQPKLVNPITAQFVGGHTDPSHSERINEFRKNEEAVFFLKKSGYKI